LKHHLSDIIHVCFIDSQDVENVFDTLKHGFIDYNNDVYKDIQKADYEFSGPFAYQNIT
jgi:hypothetical protein